MHLECRSSAEAEGHNGGTNGAAEGDAAAAASRSGLAPPPPACSIVEVFLGGLAPNASEEGVRAALGASGLLPSLSWVRLQMKEDHEEGDDLDGGGGAYCNGVAHLGFSSRPAAIQACLSVRQVISGIWVCHTRGDTCMRPNL